MTPLLLAWLFTAAPNAAQAAALAKAKNWDTLYLTFAPAKPDGYRAAERSKIAAALAVGCEGLLPDDVNLATEIGEKSVAFAPTVNGCLCAAMAARKSQQHDVAEQVLNAGLSKFQGDDSLKLEHIRLLLDEGDRAGAEKTYSAMKKNSALGKSARSLLFGSAGPQTEGAEVPASVSRVGSNDTAGTETSTYQSGVDDEGRRIRFNSHFRFRYFNGKRDFGQRAEYEGRVQQSVEEARQTVIRLLGVTRKLPLDVILYSKSEFAIHHGESYAKMVAGTYSQNAIRMNDSAEVNARNQVVLVHEFVHAVVDELAQSHAERVPVWVNEGLAEIIEWRAEGHEDPRPAMVRHLKDLAAQQRLPQLSDMRRAALIAQDEPETAYSFSALAVRTLAAKVGMSQVLAFIKGCGEGQNGDDLFRRHFGRDLNGFQKEMEAELK
jgi:hypothetical protein